MIASMMLVLAVQAAPDEQPPEFRFATGCVAIADVAASDITKALHKPSLTQEERVTVERSAMIFARVSDRAKIAERMAASLEGLSPADQDLMSRQQRRVFQSVPGELRVAMVDSCVYRFARELMPD
jgi:glycosyltransferase A (GT-A) superfamily protein (DUF2064 family)